ncbi:MAG TPA: hypothetical protein VMT12_16865 [Syntrophales bacterium]|nr:hypothetical protein [Syntrophales bacterium]
MIVVDSRFRGNDRPFDGLGVTGRFVLGFPIRSGMTKGGNPKKKICKIPLNPRLQKGEEFVLDSRTEWGVTEG